jgi:histidine triad (HIT) family protein
MTNGVDTGPSVFTRILQGDIPAEILLQTDRVFVIRDVAPQAPVHLLVIPKTAEYKDLPDLAANDPGLLAELVQVAQAAAVQAGSPDFRLVFNTGAGAGQTVFHVHAHVLGGAQQHEQSLGGAEQHERGPSAAQRHQGNLAGGDLQEGSLGRG